MAEYSLGVLAPIEGTEATDILSKLKEMPNSCVAFEVIEQGERECVLFKLRGRHRNMVTKYASEVSPDIVKALAVEVNNTTDTVWVGCYETPNWQFPTLSATGKLNRRPTSPSTPIEETEFKTILIPDSEDIREEYGTLSSYFGENCGLVPPVHYLS